MASVLLVCLFNRISECANQCVSTFISVSCSFSWAFSFRLFVLFYSSMLGFVFSHLGLEKRKEKGGML